MDGLKAADELLTVELAATLAGLSLAAAAFTAGMMDTWKERYKTAKQVVEGTHDPDVKASNIRDQHEHVVDPANDLSSAGRSLIYAFYSFLLLAVAEIGVLDSYLDSARFLDTIAGHSDLAVETGLAGFGAVNMVRGAIAIRKSAFPKFESLH